MQSKSNEAALVAQTLASERSWANEFVPTPAHGERTVSADVTMTSSGLVYQGIPDELPPAYEDIAKNEPVELPADGRRPISSQEFRWGESIENPPSIQEPDPNRYHVREQKHGSISGVFTVFDGLDLTTDFGSITITLDPRPGDTPLVIRLTATHGAIQVKLSNEYIEQLKANGKLTRPWDVRIRAKFGAVDAQLPVGLGSKIFLKSRWAAVTSTFFVADPGQHDATSEVEVETHGGAQVINFKSLQGIHPITNISGDYHAKLNGSIKVVYPDTWHGRIHAKTSRGRVKIEGSNLQLQEYGTKETHASRGAAQQITLIRCDGHGKAKVEC